MPSRADVERYADANRNIRQLVLAALRRFWSTLDLSKPREVRDALHDVLPDLVATYGDLAATIAADFYDDMREQSGAGDNFVALLADPPDLNEIRGRTFGAIGPLFGKNPQPTMALNNMEQLTDELTLQTGRDTIARSAHSDPKKPRWARVPVGETCAFCLMLASRGAVYRSAETAGEGRKFHGNDDCQVVPFWVGDPLPEGYDPDALQRQYFEARREAKKNRGSESTKAILAELRDDTGGH